MLEVKNLSKQFAEHTAVEDISFKVNAGEVFCLLGANGAGKTTTLNMLLGFEMPSRGKALLDGVDLVADRELRRDKIMYVPENVNLYDEFSAVENIAYLAELSNTATANADIHAALKTAGLAEDFHHRLVGGFSKGMRQKVAIAFAILKQARLVLMDEPTSGLDPVATRDFIAVVNTLKAQQASVLIVTHDLQCAHLLADQIAIMSRGKIIDLIENKEVSLERITQRYFDNFAA
ncbi:MAG: ABC transporter ATP-binding protein [Methylophaga sp.]|nr:ABC transporter ATP-binding protein [Methylophaga sp.]